MRNLFYAAVAALTLALAAPASAAVTLQTSDGKLTGATGVNVNGTLYNVQFVEGTCVSVFGGCDSNTDFAFGTSGSAQAAAQALLDQVFTGVYDTSTSLTFGCTDTFLCESFIPYSTTGVTLNHPIQVAVADNYSGSGDGVFISGFVSGEDSSGANGSFWHYAVFTPSAAAVPEPATWAMMLLGFGGIGFQMRRKNKIALSAA